MHKKQIKTRAEATAEEYFPVGQKDIKHAVEKKYGEETSPVSEIKKRKVVKRTC